MSRIKYNELLATLPKFNFSALRLEVEKSNIKQFIHNPANGLESFVAPDLLFSDEEIGLEQAQVILLSAPAAVGKSSLARQLSFESGNPLWELGRFSLGSNFFTGTIADSYGFDNFSKLQKKIQKGEMCLILDGADEALVRAGAHNYAAALENLAQLVKGNEALGPSAVILGRPDTTQESNRVLKEHGVRTKVLTVSFFSEYSARQFVAIKARGEGVYEIAKKELNNFLTKFFDDVTSALGVSSWSSAESFLGYAPVLDSLATFYKREDNPLRILEELKRAKTNSHVWDMLIEILDNVLDRESDKFADSFGAQDADKYAFGKQTYSRNLQLSLLMADLPETVDVDFPSDETVDAAWLERLEEQIRLQYRDHPFLAVAEQEEANVLLRFANVAFRDYVYAASLDVMSPSKVEDLASYWQDSLVNPSPMLIRFIFSSSLGLESVASAAIPAIFDSHVSSFQKNSWLSLTVFNSDNNEQNNISLTLYDNDFIVKEIESTRAIKESIYFTRSLANCSIDAPNSTIVLGSGARDFGLGPNVSVHGKHLDSECVELRLTGNEADGVVNVRVERVQGSTRRIISPVPGILLLDVPTAAYPWQQHQVTSISELTGPSESEIYWAGMSMRKNISWFLRQASKGSLSYPAGAMEAIAGKGRADSDMLAYCKAIGVMVKNGEYLNLTLPGFPAGVVVLNDITNNSYRKFLIEYIEWISTNHAYDFWP